MGRKILVSLLLFTILLLRRHLKCLKSEDYQLHTTLSILISALMYRVLWQKGYTYILSLFYLTITIINNVPKVWKNYRTQILLCQVFLSKGLCKYIFSNYDFFFLSCDEWVSLMYPLCWLRFGLSSITSIISIFFFVLSTFFNSFYKYFYVRSANRSLPKSYLWTGFSYELLSSFLLWLLDLEYFVCFYKTFGISPSIY
jgi:hypothetical protein